MEERLKRKTTTTSHYWWRRSPRQKQKSNIIPGHGHLQSSIWYALPSSSTSTRSGNESIQVAISPGCMETQQTPRVSHQVVAAAKQTESETTEYSGTWLAWRHGTVPALRLRLRVSRRQKQEMMQKKQEEKSYKKREKETTKEVQAGPLAG